MRREHSMMLKLYIILGLVTCLVADDAPSIPESGTYGDSRLDGYVTDISEFPYQVSIQYSNIHICGGSIIALDTVLTAAQCFYRDQEVSHYSVVTNSSSYDDEFGRRHTVKDIRIHRKYNEETMDYDIAVLTVSPNFTLASGTSIVKLKNQGGYVLAGISCRVSGWGSTMTTLNYDRVNIKNTDDCRRENQRDDITSQMICTDGSQRTECYGDSGNPLVCDGVQIGVTSGSHGCSSTQDVYTKVSALSDWIVNGAGRSTQINIFIFVLTLISLIFGNKFAMSQ